MSRVQVGDYVVVKGQGPSMYEVTGTVGDAAVICRGGGTIPLHLVRVVCNDEIYAKFVARLESPAKGPEGPQRRTSA